MDALVIGFVKTKCHQADKVADRIQLMGMSRLGPACSHITAFLGCSIRNQKHMPLAL